MRFTSSAAAILVVLFTSSIARAQVRDPGPAPQPPAPACAALVNDSEYANSKVIGEVKLENRPVPFCLLGYTMTGDASSNPNDSAPVFKEFIVVKPVDGHSLDLFVALSGLHFQRAVVTLYGMGFSVASEFQLDDVTVRRIVQQDAGRNAQERTETVHFRFQKILQRIGGASAGFK